jgi:anti-sigma factor RsiW
MTCPEMKKNLADLVFDSRPLHDEEREHIAQCPDCAAELAGMKATWKLLDEWQAPEPSAFFDAKLYARLRREQSTVPASLFERARAWLLYSSNLKMRQLAAGGALATALVIGGGTFALLDNQPAVPMAQTSATVRDLQSYDGNAQLFQQLNALDGDEDSVSGASN